MSNATTNTTEIDGVLARGKVTSPDYPAYYPSLLDCFWRIKAPAGFTLRIRFDDLNIESSGGCVYDFLDVVHLNSEGDTLRYVVVKLATVKLGGGA